MESKIKFLPLSFLAFIGFIIVLTMSSINTQAITITFTTTVTATAVDYQYWEVPSLFILIPMFALMGAALASHSDLNNVLYMTLLGCLVGSFVGTMANVIPFALSILITLVTALYTLIMQPAKNAS